MTICEVPDCASAATLRGYCRRCYSRLRAQGALAVLPIKTYADRVAEHSRQDGECLVWTGAQNYGYGVTRHDGRVWLVHRLAWVLANGAIPSATPHVLHRCDNPSCFRVEHLFLGTQQDNNLDKFLKGRQARGEQRSRLTEADVREIRRLAAMTTMLQHEIGQLFGVTQQTVHRIVARKDWRHVA